MAATKLPQRVIDRILSGFGENGEKRGECLVVHGLTGTKGHHWEVSISLNSLFETKEKGVFVITPPAFSGFNGKVLTGQKPVGWDNKVVISGDKGMVFGSIHNSNNDSPQMGPNDKLVMLPPNTSVTTFLRSVLQHYAALAKTWVPTTDK